jgi:hypothetical protein
LQKLISLTSTKSSIFLQVWPVKLYVESTGARQLNRF